MKIEIEHGVKITKGWYKNGGAYAEAFRSMKVGDSFVVPAKSRGTATIAAIRLGMKAATRRIDDKSVRVWRIK